MKEYFLNLSVKQKIIIIGILLVMIVFFLMAYYYFYLREDNNKDVFVENLTSLNETNENNEDPFSLSKKNSKVVVHVIGEVNSPGVVTLSEGARIIDAINEAGNITENADLSRINLAYVLEDGIQIYVPRIGENKEDLITEDAGDGIIVESAKMDNDDKKNIKVNINSANLEKLQTLPGVGVSTAQKIIDYRENNGKFKEIEDLKNVPGIGESKFSSLKEMITVK